LRKLLEVTIKTTGEGTAPARKPLSKEVETQREETSTQLAFWHIR